MRRRSDWRRSGKFLSRKEELSRRIYLPSFLERNQRIFEFRRSWFYIIMGILCWWRIWEFMARAAEADGGVPERYVALTWTLIYVTIWVARNF
jgi:hypothetical protein